nr:BTB/POZ and MATH domain-containing protein 3-like [Aegilops tauschii subsp. strangulata]
MASEPQRTASTHRTKLVRGTHQFDIVGYSQRKHLGSVADKYCFTIIRSGAFSAGGHTWELGCWFDYKGELSSISLELVSLRITKDVVAKASLRIEDPLGESPPAVWRSGGSNVFSISTTATSGMTWKLSVPRAFLAHESSYVRDDRLTIHCTVYVIIEACTPTTEDMPPLCMTEIRAHKLVLAMQSPVFAAQLRWQTNDGAAATRVVIEDMRASTFRAMLRFIYTDELPIKPTSKDQPACKQIYAARRREAMARDLLVAADRYDVERPRLMCENILSESMDTTNVMATLLVVRGRYSCRQLEDSCIEYIASAPAMCAAVTKTQEFQELIIKESCT